MTPLPIPRSERPAMQSIRPEAGTERPVRFRPGENHPSGGEIA
jgi:hypothetical protein